MSVACAGSKPRINPKKNPVMHVSISPVITLHSHIKALLVNQTEGNNYFLKRVNFTIPVLIKSETLILLEKLDWPYGHILTLTF